MSVLKTHFEKKDTKQEMGSWKNIDLEWGPAGKFASEFANS